MPNHIVNHISLQGDPKKIRSMLETIKSDEHGIGSVDFNKIVPMSKSLDIEAGSRTDRGLKAYRDFIDVYTLAGTMNMEKLRNIPVESEEIFLRQRTDIRRDEWELGKAAWRNIRDFGAPTWYDWCISNWGTKWNAYGYSEDKLSCHAHPGQSAEISAPKFLRRIQSKRRAVSGLAVRPAERSSHCLRSQHEKRHDVLITSELY